MCKVKTAVILAAGCGSRIKSLSKGIPKSLLKINGEVILSRLLYQLKSSGIQKLVVVVGYKKSEVSRVVKQVFPQAIIIENNDYLSDKNLNSFKKAISVVNEDTLVFTSDIILDDSLAHYLCKLLKDNKSFWVTNGKLKLGVVGNIIKSDKNYNVTDIKLLPQYSPKYKNYTKWTGLMYVNSKDLLKYKKVCNDYIYKTSLFYYSQPFIENLSKFNFLEFNIADKYKFATFNTPEEYKNAVKEFKGIS